jgi:hypothetical protein
LFKARKPKPGESEHISERESEAFSPIPGA